MRIGDRQFHQLVETLTATAKRNPENVEHFLNLSLTRAVATLEVPSCPGIVFSERRRHALALIVRLPSQAIFRFSER